MITVRSIISEALSRSNIVSRRQTPPADKVETGYQLLRGIAKKYSDDNLLQFLVSDVSTPLDRQEFVVGDIDPEAPEEYMPVDIEAAGAHKINEVYWRSKEPTELGSYIELKYASPTEFDAYPNGSAVYTCQPVNDRQLMLKVKLLPDPRLELKINYNRKWSFDLDSVLRVPEQYEELFIVALTHKFAVTFPRLSTEQVNILKGELTDMENSVKTSSRAIKYVTRKPATRTYCSAADFYSGAFLFPNG